MARQRHGVRALRAAFNVGRVQPGCYFFGLLSNTHGRLVVLSKPTASQPRLPSSVSFVSTPLGSFSLEWINSLYSQEVRSLSPTAPMPTNATALSNAPATTLLIWM